MRWRRDIAAFCTSNTSAGFASGLPMLCHMVLCALSMSVRLSRSKANTAPASIFALSSAILGFSARIFPKARNHCTSEARLEPAGSA